MSNIGVKMNSFRAWLITVETSANDIPELKTAVQTAVQSGQQAKKAVQNTMMKKLSDPKVDLDQVADLAKMSDKLTDQDDPKKTMGGSTTSFMKKKMKKRMKK